jgi:ABC-2 type transport system ATP-binding protein
MGDVIVAVDVGVAVGHDWLFRELTVSLPGGQCLALTGPNGTGKSTLLHCIYGLRAPTEGRLTVCGGPPDERAAPFRQAVSVLLDDSALFDELTPRHHPTCCCGPSPARGHRLIR